MGVIVSYTSHIESSKKQKSSGGGSGGVLTFLVTLPIVIFIFFGFSSLLKINELKEAIPVSSPAPTLSARLEALQGFTLSDYAKIIVDYELIIETIEERDSIYEALKNGDSAEVSMGGLVKSVYLLDDFTLSEDKDDRLW